MSENYNKEDYIIRDFTPNDYDEVNILWDSLGLGGKQRGDSLNIILNTLKIGGKFLILEKIKNKEIIGTAWLTTDLRRIYLHHFGIKITEQGKGLSNLLCYECVCFAKNNNMQIKLEVHKENKKAISLYLKHNFKYLGDYDVYIIRNIN